MLETEDKKIEKNALAEAKELTREYEEKISCIIKFILKNDTISITITTVLAYIILYTFNWVILLHFGIPREYINIDIKSYICILSALGIILVLSFFYYREYKADKLTNISKFNKSRFTFMLIVFLYIIIELGFTGMGVKALYLIISLTLFSLVIELVVCGKAKKLFKQKNTKSRQNTLSQENYEDLLNSYVSKFIHLYSYRYVKIVSYILSIISFSSMFAIVYTYNLKSFQCFEGNGSLNIVIVDYGEKALVMNGQIDDKNNITIHKGVYKLVSKMDVEIKKRAFDNIILK